MDLPDLAALVDALPAAELPAAIGALAAAQARALARLTTPVAPDETRVPNDGALLTYAAAGAVLGIPAGCVRDLVRRGELPSVRVGRKYVRVYPDDLADYIAQHRDPDREGSPGARAENFVHERIDFVHE